VLKEYDEFLSQCTHEAVHNSGIENCYGDQINNSKNMILGFAIIATNDSFYCATE
jgi:hypothetical protein